ncbi:MAG TPA: sugar ABC transporter permease, partial [Bellilinea sp.]|nr:sugar ABC transporter permease [Bellilinea sp.]
RNLFLLPYVIPAIALALVWRWMLDGSFGIVSYGLQQLGLLAADQSPLAIPKGAMVSVILANVWRGFPFVMVTYWAALQAIDEEQYDAAKVDGANVLQEFFAITLPNLKNATIVLMILRGIWTFTYFDLIWLITRGGPAGATEHWPIWIYQEAMGSLRFGSAAALGVLMALGLFVLIAAYARISGFVSGRDA